MEILLSMSIFLNIVLLVLNQILIKHLRKALRNNHRDELGRFRKAPK